MTELLNKKSREGRYRVEPNIVETDPVVEPLTGLDDDEDAIDRLLINTGFDAKEDVSVLPAVEDKALALHQEPVPPFEAFGDDAVLAAMQTDADEYVEPVDIGSPLADSESAPEPLQYGRGSAHAEALPGSDNPADVAGERAFSASHTPASAFSGAIHDDFALPAGTDEALPPVDLERPLPEAGPEKTPFAGSAPLEDCRKPFDGEPELAGITHPLAGNGTAVAGYAESPAADASPGEAIAGAFIAETSSIPDAPAAAGEGNRLPLPAEDAALQSRALLEAKARNARRLSYAAVLLSLAALCAASAAFYLNVRTRTELTKLKDMQSIMEEDLGGLNEKLDNGKQGAEEPSETPSRFPDESPARPEDQSAEAQAPASRETGSLQVAVSPAFRAAPQKTSEPASRQIHVLTVKPAKNTASPKSSGTNPEKPDAGEAEGHWSVNLAAFRQLEDARKKAAEFRHKGVPVKVKKIDIKRGTWYRLSVQGFATKEAASAHSARLKKLLRLNSIWVAAI